MREEKVELWECALNRRIFNNLQERSEEDALKRLLSCNLFAVKRTEKSRASAREIFS